MGVSSNGGTPKTTRKNDENPWLLGTSILGNPLYLVKLKLGFHGFFMGFTLINYMGIHLIIGHICEFPK